MRILVYGAGVQGCVVHSVVGFRSKDLLILEDEFKACSDELRVMTDDGSYGTKGVVTAALDELVAAGNQYDLVITIDPLIMMKFVVKTCQKHGLKSIVSMNPIMIDGTGMCGTDLWQSFPQPQYTSQYNIPEVNFLKYYNHFLVHI